MTNLLKHLTVVASLLALAAPVAHADIWAKKAKRTTHHTTHVTAGYGSRALQDLWASKANRAKRRIVHKKVVAKVTSHAKSTSGAKSTGPIMIIVKTSGTPAPVTVDDCATSGNDCTPEQLCELWGMNCDQVQPVDPTTAATSETQTTSG